MAVVEGCGTKSMSLRHYREEEKDEDDEDDDDDDDEYNILKFWQYFQYVVLGHGRQQLICTYDKLSR